MANVDKIEIDLILKEQLSIRLDKKVVFGGDLEVSVTIMLGEEEIASDFLFINKGDFE